MPSIVLLLLTLLWVGGGMAGNKWRTKCKHKGGVCVLNKVQILTIQNTPTHCTVHQNPEFGQTFQSYQPSFYCDVRDGYRCYVPR